ncbi:C-type cyclin [Polyplosphaeria fusca]|uniref:RNA polymerase II holoenzyme cyclin-like subunit n=1 Tax=Polyplosphaeria fusca TaxID=682080 RepID=A0A9P4QT29_9PLEO|nr:C-type cyclin [Polyplosphaeria fusca]
MSPAAAEERIGPHPSHIEVAQSYMLQSKIQQCLVNIGMSEAQEDQVRLRGVEWIDSVRRSLQLPIRTFNTAVVYYHKFRLKHADHEYNWADAAAAALFTACKIEDTLKKSREILCASWNLKLPSNDHISPDDPRLDLPSKNIVGLERLMLECASFDFRNRYPQKIMVKLLKAGGFDKDTEAKTAWNISIDMYRTFTPLKQSTSTMALSCIELAARLHDMDVSRFADDNDILSCKSWYTSREEILETMRDILDLWTQHRAATLIAPHYELEKFLSISIALNQEAAAANFPRYTLYASERDKQDSNGASKPRNGNEVTSPLTPATPGTTSPRQRLASVIGTRGQNGTTRFMLDPAKARLEMKEVEKYFKIEEEEYEVEVSVEPEKRVR